MHDTGNLILQPEGQKQNESLSRRPEDARPTSVAVTSMCNDSQV